MDIYKVLTLPDPILREVAPQVQTITDAIRTQGQKMVETMYAYEGIGLAAPQVGILNRVIVIDTARREKDAKNPILMINPELVWSSDETWVCTEGCLSIPQQYADVSRPRKVRVRFLNAKGEFEELEASDLTATCIQHEIDHLDGVLFIDHLSRLKRTNLLKKYDKWKKEQDFVL